MVRRQRTAPKEPSKIDWAQMAAYIDGEGCIGLYLYEKRRDGGKTRRNEYLFVTVVNTDPRLGEWCRDTFGGRFREVPRVDRVRHKPCYEWKVNSNVAAHVLTGCLPFFKIKREQAEIGLAFQRTRLKQGGQIGRGKGQPRVPAKVLSQRNRYHAELKFLRTQVIAPQGSAEMSDEILGDTSLTVN